jgi:hypothetical protein
MISEVAEASGLLDAVRNELAFAEGWPEERDVAQIRATMERSFRCTARTLPGMGLTCPACGTSMPGIRCPKCNRKLAVLEVELQHMAKETIE